ncbi:porin [Vibrio sagamiensis]|uniref:Outer membrane protein U n=1 Tax=Vibrio sagamiensis NBRC 104589 TaxID=1219064 RepID=A0A511QC17_9VIBR|nr:porin [Vibrio sagamiensis]PNQ71846.1 porin [Vibrio agarivorans]GEM73962.1 outer membrane protein U [Vibrio sagamiensis NBRC 104589]
MKKTLIALSVSAVAMATCVNAAEIYNQDGTSFEIGGRAEGRLALQDGDVTDKSRVRINVLGKQMINDELYGLGFWEGEFTSADDESIDTRYLYAGLGGKFGEVSYGKTQGSLMVLTDFTDIMSFHGNSAAYKLAVADRTDNMLAYKGQFDNLALRASYRFDSPVKEKENKDSNADVDTDGYSLSAIYAVADTGLELGAGYADQYDISEYMLAASYTVDNLYFAGLLTDSDDYTGYELAAAYTMGQTVFSSTYNNAETNDETSANNLAIDATYYFKPNFRGYVSYNFNMLDEDDITTAEDKVKTEDEVALGLRYDF